MNRPRQLRGVFSDNNVRCVNGCRGERDMGLDQGLLHMRCRALGAGVRYTNSKAFRGFVVHFQNGISTMARNIVTVYLQCKSVMARTAVIGQVYSTTRLYRSEAKIHKIVFCNTRIERK